ncbi:unnamed protein product [Protopolystoma xenopodis]|uniref:Uncharacterized protein n=1 Tax=Protopolystoma xenopodis TaxID=117903 RepID=A0A3S5AUB8_9PLAT|nr:unnamed protein product [Protopolystoma xenopodis]
MHFFPLSDSCVHLLPGTFSSGSELETIANEDTSQLRAGTSPLCLSAIEDLLDLPENSSFGNLLAQNDLSEDLFRPDYLSDLIKEDVTDI